MTYNTAIWLPLIIFTCFRLIFSIQVIIIVVATILDTPVVERRQIADLLGAAFVNTRDNVQPHVELTCRFPAYGLVTSLCYNVLLVVVCTWYAFKTRHLPDNFNESRCITFCVYTTLVIWLAFVPTFFTASRAVYEVALLSCALLMNGTVTLLSLYVPRVYGLYADRTKPPTATPCQYTVPVRTRLTAGVRCAPEYTSAHTMNGTRRSEGSCCESVREMTSCAIECEAASNVITPELQSANSSNPNVVS